MLAIQCDIRGNNQGYDHELSRAESRFEIIRTGRELLRSATWEVLEFLTLLKIFVVIIVFL